MVQIQGGEGEAVVSYREPSKTKEMRYHRLSQTVKNMTNFLLCILGLIQILFL